MREGPRIDRILAQLNVYWKMNPDLRLGQIVCNLSRDEQGHVPATGVIFNMEDGVVEKALRVANEHRLGNNLALGTGTFYLDKEEVKELEDLQKFIQLLRESSKNMGPDDPIMEGHRKKLLQFDSLIDQIKRQVKI